jgi:hypothetical protein
MLAPADTPMVWAARHSPDRISAVGVLAVRIRRYLTDNADPSLAAIPDLRVRINGQPERPLWHESTGLYGFLNIPPGNARIEIDDPAGRYQPQAVATVVPDRSALKTALEDAEAPPVVPAPAYPEVDLRPGPAMGLPPGTTALWGVLREGTRALPGVLLNLTTVRNGGADTVSTLSGPDGSYLLLLPFEAIDRGVNPPLRLFERTLTVFAPRPVLSAALAALGFLAGQPAGVFGLSAAQRNALFLPRGFQLREAGGALHPQVGNQNPPVSVSVGKKIRLDIELLP